MARPVSSDFLHNMRFHVTASPNGGREFLPKAVLSNGKPQAGFSACGTPSASVAVAEYREGHYVYTRKQPGIPAVENISMSRGVVLADTEFWNWLRQVIEGTGEYRADLTVSHYHRDALPNNTFPITETRPAESLNMESAASTLARQYQLFEALPVGHKAATDLDSSSSEISVQNLDVAFESWLPSPVSPT